MGGRLIGDVTSSRDGERSFMFQLVLITFTMFYRPAGDPAKYPNTDIRLAAAGSTSTLELQQFKTMDACVLASQNTNNEVVHLGATFGNQPTPTILNGQLICIKKQ
jgi:hypothetical protein